MTILRGRTPAASAPEAGRALRVTRLIMVWLAMAAQTPAAVAQVVLFDFDAAPLHAPLPLDQSAGGITAHLSATGQGYSIQEASVLGFTPVGFSGFVISPSSINLADLLVRFDQALDAFSIMYACQELGCDDAATMRVTAYLNGSLVGTNTRTATQPGTWPVDTLSCSFPQGFDSVVVHYDSRPPTCQDYGTIFMADNMRVTAMPTEAEDTPAELPAAYVLENAYPAPFNPATTIRFRLPRASRVVLRVWNTLGQPVATLVDAAVEAGVSTAVWNASGAPGGVYYYRLEAVAASGPGAAFAETKKLVLVK